MKITAKFVSRKSKTETCLSFLNMISSFKEVYDGVATKTASWRANYTCTDSDLEPEDSFPWVIVGVSVGVLIVVVIGGIFGYKYFQKKKSTEGRAPLVDNA